jgi:transcription elongation GreA/GreB family factor
MNLDFKYQVHEACIATVDEKIKQSKQELRSLIEDGNESKGSAGDKHETAKAMNQLEQEKLGLHIEELEKQKAELQKIDLSLDLGYIMKGSLVFTNQGYIFVAIGLGKVKVKEQLVYAVSTSSPLGKEIVGHKRNEQVDVNGISYEIKKIW